MASYLRFLRSGASQCSLGLTIIVATLCLSATSASAATNLCRTLNRREVAAAQIALPTRGAVVDSAKLVTNSAGGFCKVLGHVRSIDPVAQPIRFEVNLPNHWNHKALQFGGGAFDGYLHESDGLRNTVVGDRRQPTPLERGYATFGGDSGHHHHYLFFPDVVNALSARFALNEEQRKNFASESLKKTHDVALALMRSHYSAAPIRMYFIGGSTGGREAMQVVDHWPEDYDGVMAAYAAWNQIESDLQFIHVSQAMYTKSRDGQSGWLPRASTKLLRDAVLEACDAQDGLKDKIVSNPAQCQFDPATLRCPDGNAHKGCLSDGQERTVTAFVNPQVSDFKVANGIDSEPGYNVLRGADLVGNMGLLHHAFHPAFPLLNSFYYVVGDGVLRFFLTRDPHFNSLTFNTKNAGRWLPGILQQSAEDDASLADLTPFERHGGKLLLVHGTADATIPTGASIFLYQRIVEAMGQARVNAFVRLWLIPGYGHGSGRFDAGFDTIGVLDAWADQGIAPGRVSVTDQHHAPRGDSRSNSPSRTRPLCGWPTWPKYTGGAINSAASFTCQLNP